MEPYIYSMVNKTYIQDIMESLHTILGLTVQLLDESGNILEIYGEQTSYCKHFTSHLSTAGTCNKIHATAGKRAMGLGTSYIFSCHSNLNHIVFPLINQDNLFGSILIGPFLMAKPDSTLVLEVGRHYPDLTMEDLMELYDASTDLQVVDPAKVTQISRLVYHLMSNMISEARELFIINQKKMIQQAKISESIHMYKNQEQLNLDQYPLEKEHLLISKVREGNIQESSSLLNELLGYVFLAGGSNLATVKYRCVELCSLLSRAAIENGATSNHIFLLNNHFMESLDSYTTTDQLCYAITEILNGFVECMFPPTLENSKLIRDAMNYISTHFSMPITLQDVADCMHLNPSYFSRIFKQSSGYTFKEYLTQVRIEEAKRLLRNTNYSLLDIAIAVGFDNQSYFTSVFKKHTGLTPKQFRK